MLVVEQMNRTEFLEEKSLIYSYRLTKKLKVLDSSGERIEIQAYGIEVERQDFCNGVLINVEREFIESISPQRYKVKNLLNLLYDNLVSPIHLIDVLGEYIDEYVSDFDRCELELAIN